VGLAPRPAKKATKLWTSKTVCRAGQRNVPEHKTPLIHFQLRAEATLTQIRGFGQVNTFEFKTTTAAGHLLVLEFNHMFHGK